MRPTVNALRVEISGIDSSAEAQHLLRYIGRRMDVVMKQPRASDPQKRGTAEFVLGDDQDLIDTLVDLVILQAAARQSSPRQVLAQLEAGLLKLDDALKVREQNDEPDR